MSNHSTLIATCDGNLALSSHRTHLRVIEGGLTHTASQAKNDNDVVPCGVAGSLHEEADIKPVCVKSAKTQAKPQRMVANHQAQINPKISQSNVNASVKTARSASSKKVDTKPLGQVIAFSSTQEVIGSWPHAFFAFATSLAFVFVILCGWLISDLHVQSKLENAFSAASHETVVVHQGDSLWSIAAEHPVYGCTTSQVVHHIREVNGLDSACLMAGMRIEVPSAE